MHQPQYKDALTGQYALPWTYRHAVKDCTDRAAHLEGTPAARAVVTFTPLLIEQVEEIARRVAEHLHNGSRLPDPVLGLLGPDPVPREPAARLGLLRTCVRAQRQQMIERFGPYLELATIAETLGTLGRVAYASDQFIHDLAVWYHLAWLGESVRRTDPLVARLTERGRDFSPAQRRDLLTLIGALVGQVLSRYRRLAERGQCELSVTPYGHPIIPLLLDFQCARDALPGLPLPAHAAYPGGAARASWHIEEAVRVFTRAFGTRPAGCWPAAMSLRAITPCSSPSTVRTPGSITRSTASISCARCTSSSRTIRCSSSRLCPTVSGAACSPPRSRGCAPAAGCTARWRPGWGMRT